MDNIEIKKLFKKRELLKIDDIKNHKIKPNKGYDKGGFYMILNTKINTCYIGKSINFYSRLKNNLHKSCNKTNIDLALKSNISDFEFYLIATYKELSINFFNRKLETIYEHRLISEAINNNFNIYNSIHYGHI
jgi:hypothetical protein